MEGVNAARCIGDLPESYNAAEDLIESNLAAGRGGKAAVIDCNGTTTYGELAALTSRMANAWSALSIHREQRVLLCLHDTVDFPTAFLGAIKAGIVPVPLNTLLTDRDYAWIVENSGAVAVIVSAALAPAWYGISVDHPSLKFVVSGSDAASAVAAAPRGTRKQWSKLGDVLRSDASAEPAETHRDEVAFWLYTSGSTGHPKGAMHTHASMRLTANLYGRGVVGYREDDVVFSVAKQFFAYGLGNSITFPYSVGATAVLHDGRATPQAVTAIAKRHGVTVLCGVPTFFAGWFAGEGAPTKRDLPTLRLATSAGEALPPHLAKAFQDRFEIDVLDGLGSTEMLHIFLSQRPGEVRFGCTGRPVSGYEVRIVDETGAAVGVGEIGELQVKGSTMASGYWRNRPKTMSTFIGEWMRTGDKYSCSKDGWYTYGGRSDDMLKVGGIYVSPVEVEEALCSDEAVLEAAVIGAEDADGLTKPRAHVVLKAGYCGDASMEERLKAHVKAKLAPYKYPRWVVFVPDLPKTATGKIQRFRLRSAGEN
jgi:benzoate-CoA ligase